MTLTPDQHVHAYLKRGVELYSHPDFGPLLRQVQATGLFPDFPVELACAFAAPTTSRADNTALSPPGRGWRHADGSYQSGAFCECGWYQVPVDAVHATQDAAGAWHVAPVPTVATGPRFAWMRLAHDPEVTRALGRSATCAPGAWAAAAIDQHAVGLAMLRDGYDACCRALPPDVRPRARGSLWGLAVAMAAFSAGAGSAAKAFQLWAPPLRSRTDAARFGALCLAAARGYATGTAGASGHAGAHSGNPYHLLTRTLQKLTLAGAIHATIAHAPHEGPWPWDLQLGLLEGAVGRVLVAADLHQLPAAADVAALVAP